MSVCADPIKDVTGIVVEFGSRLTEHPGQTFLKRT